MKQIVIINENDGNQFAYVNGQLCRTSDCFRPFEIADMADGEPFTLTQIDVHAHDEPGDDEPEPPQQSIPTGTIDDFAEEYDLLLKVEQCTYPPNLYTARLSGVEVARDNALICVFGRGATPVQAIDNYARMISGQYLRLHNGDRVQAWTFTE